MLYLKTNVYSINNFTPTPLYLRSLKEKEKKKHFFKLKIYSSNLSNLVFF